MLQTDELAAVKRKIRKLAEIRPDRGNSEAEAFKAMETIGALLEQFNLSMDEVMLRQEPCIKGSFMPREEQKKRGLASWFSVAVANFTGTIVWFRGGNHFFGVESDVKMALYLMEIIYNAGKAELAKFKKSNTYVNARVHRKTLTANFERGFGHRISDRLNELKAERDRREKEAAKYQAEQMNGRMIGATDTAKAAAARRTTGTALISVAKDDMIRDEMQRQLGWTFKEKKLGQRSHISRGNAAAFHSGYDAGGNVNLSRPIQNSGGGSFGGYLT